MKTGWWVVLVVAVGLLLLGLRVWLSPAVLSAPHGGGTAGDSVAGMALLVLAYAVVALGILRARLGATVPERSVALRPGAPAGGPVRRWVRCGVRPMNS